MSSKRKGTVSKIGKSKYSFFVQLDGDGFYFNTKFDPKAGVGDVVGITYDQKAENRGQVKDIKLLEDNGGPKGYQDDGGSSYSGGSSNSGGGGGGGNARTESIVYQACLKGVPAIVQLLVDNGGVKLPPESKPDARRIVLEELTDELLAKYTNRALNPTDVLKAAKGVDDDAEASEGQSESSTSEESSSNDWDDDDWS